MIRITPRFIAPLLLALVSTAAVVPRAQSDRRLESPVAIPFELVTRHIMVPVLVNGGPPLAFVLDTGDKVGIIDLDRANQLKLALDRPVQVGGVGSDRLSGYVVRDASFSLAALSGFSQPISLALPFARLAARFGHDFDGIIGSDFIREFVVEIDYDTRIVRLHDPKTFTYSGPGQAISIALNALGHPVIDAAVTLASGDPIAGKYLVDIGSSGSLSLHSPFVAEHGLAAPGRTIRAIGVGGAGGESTARIGRVTAFRIGNYTLGNPIALFSQDAAGAFANAAYHGNIGNQILSRFKLFLDYGRDRMILEPTSRFSDPFDRAVSGLALEAHGKDYKTIRVFRVLENSPATEAGIREGDIITAVDDRPSSELTLTALLELFERPGSYKLTIRREQQTLTVALAPRVMI